MNINFFVYEERLGIHIPDPTITWDQLNQNEQQIMLAQWENIRGNIPDRISDLEILINQKQIQLNEEDSFTNSCKLNSEIAELASVINDLWLWYRTQQDITAKAHY